MENKKYINMLKLIMFINFIGIMYFVFEMLLNWDITSEEFNKHLVTNFAGIFICMMIFLLSEWFIKKLVDKNGGVI